MQIDIDCVVRGADILGEMPVWCDRTQKLWWLDVRRPALQSYDPATRRHIAQRLPEALQCGGLALHENGQFLLGSDAGLFSFDPAGGHAPVLVADPEQGKPKMRLNDGKCDRRGRYWVGSMFDGPREPRGSLYRVGANYAITTIFSDVILPNSICFSPDDKTMYFADTFKRIIWSFDFDIDAGEISNRQVFKDLTDYPGRPDGSTVDAEGFMWNCLVESGELMRLAPDGRVDRIIRLPVSCPTCPAFGGAGLDTLYVTSASQRIPPDQLAAEPLAGSLFAIDVGVKGLPEPRFRA